MPRNRYIKATATSVINICLLLASASMLLAQTGTIKGIVVEEESQLPLPYTNVVIVGTRIGRMTESDGSYIIKNVPVGTYTVKALAMGYKSEDKDSVVVKEDQIIHVSFQLSKVGRYRGGKHKRHYKDIRNILYDDCTVEQTEEGNFVLYVVNRSPSIDPVDIQVYLDGKLAVHGEFFKGNDPEWGKFRFMLSLGKHKVLIESKRGETISEHEIEVTDKLWARIDYIYNSELKYQKKQFFFRISKSSHVFINI